MREADGVGYIMAAAGSDGSFCGSGGRGGGSGHGCRKARDICLPTYFPTQVVHLEEQRQSLGLALMGQLVVVTFRVLTGSIGSAVIGSLVFVIGNQARCSLQTSSLTSFVILGYTIGALDSVELVRHVVDLRFSFFMLPFQENIITDLSAMAMLMAPIIEVLGARIAWDSYLTPSMLFIPQPSALASIQACRRPGSVDQDGRWFSSLSVATGFQDFAPLAPDVDSCSERESYFRHSPIGPRRRFSIGSSGEGDSQRGLSWAAGSSYGGWVHSDAAPAAAESPAAAGTGEQASTSWWSAFASTSAAAGAADDGAGVAVCSGASCAGTCHGCGKSFGYGCGMPGTGRFAAAVYCRKCWEVWRS